MTVTRDERNFGEPVTDTPPAACASCRWRDYGQATCAAFPNGIPDAILNRGNPHTAPFPGDQGIRYALTPLRETDGPVTATFISFYSEYGGALWIGDDGTIGYFDLDENSEWWMRSLMLGLSHGGDPAGIFAYWLENAFGASQPQRFAGVADVEAEHRRRLEAARVNEGQR